MGNSNLGLSFYRNYFKGYQYDQQNQDALKSFIRNQAVEIPDRISQKDLVELYQATFFEKKNKVLESFRMNDYGAETGYADLVNQNGFYGIQLETTYPGLLIGTGYTHDIAAVGATKIGFYFDHTTGLPTLPGSSVKGILRSVFPGQDLKERDKEAGKDRPDQGKIAWYNVLLEGKRTYLLEVLAELGLDPAMLNRVNFLAALEAELFDGHYTLGDNVHPIPPPQRFICHDAVVINTSGGLLGHDFITPHKSTRTGIPHELAEPNPIQLVKVLPGVRFQFTFQASDRFNTARGHNQASLLTADLLILLIRRILLDQGVGAKTNVGYGRLNVPAQPARPGAPVNEAATGQRESAIVVSATEKAKASEANFFTGSLRAGRDLEMEAIVVKSGKPNQVKVFIIEGFTPTVRLVSYRNTLEVGITVKVLIRLRRDLKTIENNQASFQGLKR